MPGTILFADNHPEFLATWTEYLELSGYQVLRAVNPEQARQILLSANIHLAIYDNRLRDDQNENDQSGIELAKDPQLSFIPAIILTDYPTYQSAREALRPKEQGALDYIDKKGDGTQGMLEAVARAFKDDILINWDLVIQWDPESGLSVPGILGMIEPKLPHNELHWRNEELDDLLRMVFYGFDEIVILRKLWIDTCRVALLVQGIHEHANRYFTITIGKLEAITPEISHLKAIPTDPT